MCILQIWPITFLCRSMIFLDEDRDFGKPDIERTEYKSCVNYWYL